MTRVPPFKALPRPAEDLMSGQESGAEVVYANSCEAEEAADRRHDFSDHLEPWDLNGVEAAWSWHMGPGPMTELDSLSWDDEDGDGFKIEAGAWRGKQAIACVHVYDKLARDFWGVFVDEGDALALIDWLQRCVRQASSAQEDIPHTDAPVKDDTK